LQFKACRRSPKGRAKNMQKNSAPKILVVDDEPSDRILLRKILSKKYIVTEASNGEEAMDIACSEKPDLILMDVMMPKVDGYTACYMIKRDPLTAEIPVAMVSGIDHKLNVRLAEKMGATGYLTKSLSPLELLDRIAKLLRNDT
jgi:putative two-component system response regulator